MSTELQPRIVVFGVGGAGGNAVDNMIKAQLQGVEFVVANTDAQALKRSGCENQIQLGLETTSGLGAGARPEVGAAAAEESLEEIELHLDGAHMVFIAAGMGGGTGTGSAPVIARIARERGILTVGVVTKPFSFEGKRRMTLAEQGLAEIKKHVDTLIIIPNQNLFRVANAQTTFADAFQMADKVLYSGVRGITDLMVMPGLINLDFADVRTVMADMGSAMMGTGEAEGENRALMAAQAAIANPLLDDVSMKGAKGVLINITGGYDMTLYEVDEAANEIRSQVDPDAEIILGSTFDESMSGPMRVSVVATGLDAEAATEAQPEAAIIRSAQPAAPQPQPQPAPQPEVKAEARPEPKPEPIAPRPVIETARPEIKAQPEPRPHFGPVTGASADNDEAVSAKAEEASASAHVRADAIDSFFGGGKPTASARAAASPTVVEASENRSNALHNLFGWRKPSSEELNAPFEDVETPAETPRSIIDDSDLEIPAFLRRSANN